MMQTDNFNSEMSLEDFIVIRDFIHEKCGVFFAENKKYLVENRLNKRMGTLGLRSYRDYFYQVKYDTSLKEFNMLMNLVTTNETSFYRNPPQLTCFQEEVLPLYLAQKLKNGEPKRLKFWSAGCSTGEEPFTLAMQLLEVLGEKSGWNLEIVANDISENVLYAARTGSYSEMALRTTPPALISRYFDRNDQKYVVKDEIKRLVKFSHLNLADRRKMALMSDMDFIFCRNVMIYFSDEVKRQIVKGFYNALRPGGYLFIGHAESLHGISKAFKLVYFKNGLVYHREATATANLQDTAVAEPVGATAGAKTTVATAVSSRPQPGTASGIANTNAATLEKLRKIQELLAVTRK